MVKKMTLKEEIIYYLLKNKSKSITIKKLSEKLKKDYKNVYNAIKDLSNTLNLKKLSNSTYISFSSKITLENLKGELFRRNQLLKNKKIKLLYSDIKNNLNPFFVVIVFGSHASFEQSNSSDIDICVLYDNLAEYKKLENIIKIHDKIDLHSFSYKEFISMLNSKKFNVGHEIANKGIILFNIESFYEMIKYE